MGEYKIAAGNFKSTFKRGATALLVLTLLQERDMYGYEIIQTLIKRSNGNFFIPEGSLYPSLYQQSRGDSRQDRHEGVLSFGGNRQAAS